MSSQPFFFKFLQHHLLWHLSLRLVVWNNWSQVAFRAFSFFFSSTTLIWRLQKYISTFFILYTISLRENTQWSESWESMENNSLATLSSTWQTKDYFFNEKFYLKTLNPKETQWKHILYISSRFFIDESSWNPCSLRANMSVLLRSGLYLLCYVIITRGKPYCLAECSMSLAFQNTKLCKIEMVSLC